MIQYGVPETTISEYPATTPGISYTTGYETSSSYQYTLPQEEVQYQTTTAAVPQTSYDYSNVLTTSDYQSVDLGYGNYQVASAPLTTSYQQVRTIKNVPVTTIKQVPVVTTRYVPATSVVGSTMGSSFVQPQLAVSPQQSFTAPLPQQGENHFVSNYPIYENDPRRVAMGLSRGLTPGLANLNNLALSQSYSLGANGLNASGLGGLNTGLGGLNTGLGGLNTGLGGLNTSGLNSGLGLGGLGSGLNNLGSGLNTLGSGLGNTGLSSLGSGLNKVGSGLNAVNNLSSGLNNLTSGAGTATGGLDNLASAANGLTEGLGSNLVNDANNLADGVNTLTDGVANTGSFADNLRSGTDTALEGTNAGLSNFANNVVDTTNNLATSTKEGVNNVSTEVKNLFK